jgi:hypothetical protein
VFLRDNHMKNEESVCLPIDGVPCRRLLGVTLRLQRTSSEALEMRRYSSDCEKELPMSASVEHFASALYSSTTCLSTCMYSADV